MHIQPRIQAHFTPVKRPWLRLVTCQAVKIIPQLERVSEYWEQLCLSCLQKAFIKPTQRADFNDKTSRLFGNLFLKRDVLSIPTDGLRQIASSSNFNLTRSRKRSELLTK